MREHEAGAKISGATFYKWKAKYGGLDVSDAKRLKSLEDENAKQEAFGRGNARQRDAEGYRGKKCMVRPGRKVEAVFGPQRHYWALRSNAGKRAQRGLRIEYNSSHA